MSSDCPTACGGRAAAVASSDGFPGVASAPEALNTRVAALSGPGQNKDGQEDESDQPRGEAGGHGDQL